MAFTVETVYIYGAVADKGNEMVADVMKAALVKALDHYDILGGRMKLNDVENRIEINRNYKGAQFATASCNATVAGLGDLNIPHPFFRYLKTEPKLPLPKMGKQPSNQASSSSPASRF